MLLETFHITRDFQDGHLRHKIVTGFARRCSLEFVEHERADWPGDCPCPL